MIVGNDQEGDDCVITAHVCLCFNVILCFLFGGKLHMVKCFLSA